MKPKINPKLIAMMAACAIVANAASVSTARAQGMPADAQQLIQTMRPMYVSETPAEPTQHQADESAYGGTTVDATVSATP